MTIDEINQYINLSSRSNICVYREGVKDLPLIIMSLYITGRPGDYLLTAEFDPVDMVDNGEGWIWFSEFTDMSQLIEQLEVFLEADICNWENISKTGKLAESYVDIDDNEYLEQEKMFLNKFDSGQHFLPSNISWKTKNSEIKLDSNKLH